MTRPANFVDALLWSLCILCAVSLQTQITLFASEDYLGLRINLTDIVAPLAGVAILVTLLNKSSRWPEWNIPHFYGWLSFLTFVLIAAFLNGWYLYDELSYWALVNKVGGWFILLAIMGLGAWIGANAKQQHLQLFLRLFLYFLLPVLICNIFAYMLMALQGPANFFIAGFMANRNAFAFLFIVALTITTCFYFSKVRLVPLAYTYALFFLMPFFFIANGSRAGWICIGIVLSAFAIIQRKQLKKCAMLVFFVALGTLALNASYHINGKTVALVNPSVMGVFEGEPENYRGDQIRIAVLKVAMPLIQERPVFGSGLGSIMMEQKKNTGEVINLLDNTSLWLLTETGIMGLLAFSAFYFIAVRRIFRNMTEDEEFSKTLRQSILFMILGFTILCLFHELLYTRFLWFFLGLGLAIPARMRQDG